MRVEKSELEKKLHRAWVSMIQRCENPNATGWHNYGGRPGNPVRICKRWRKSFEHFAADVGLPPSLKHSIDRINVQQGYRPSNVRWATAKTQANNRSVSLRHVRMPDGLVSISDAAKTMGLSYAKVYARITLGGMPVSQSLVAAHYTHPKMAKQYGDAALLTKSVKQHAAEHGVNYSTVLVRLWAGMSLADALFNGRLAHGTLKAAA